MLFRSHPEGVGCAALRIQPQATDLAWLRATLPTVRGPVQAEARREGATWTLALALPPDMAWRLDLPAGWRCLSGADHGQGGTPHWTFLPPQLDATA